MTFITLFTIAVGLAMDAFAVAISCGFLLKKYHLRMAFRIAFAFGGFQAIMPFLGWSAGFWAKDFVEAFDHWVAFGLLFYIGSHMLWEAFSAEDQKSSFDPTDIMILLGLAVATSIDALAVGLSFAVLDVSIVSPALIIGLVAFIFSFLGVYIGKRFGHFFESKIEIVGAILLMGIGLKILISHLV